MNDTLLKIYLNDHLAGAVAGIELCRRAARENTGNAVGAFLAGYGRALEEDRHILESVMAALVAMRDPVKQTLAWLGERVGRLKLNGRIVGYSALSRLVELEGLCLGAEGRVLLWRTLLRLQRQDPRLAGFDFAQPLTRAELHRRDLERLRLAAADTAFTEAPLHLPGAEATQEA